MRIKRYDHTRIIITYSFSWKTQTKALPSYIPFPKKIETGFQVVTSRWLYMTFNTFNAYFQVSHFSLSFCCLYSHPFCSQISTEKKSMAMAPDTSKIIHPAQIQVGFPYFLADLPENHEMTYDFLPISSHIPILNCWVFSDVLLSNRVPWTTPGAFQQPHRRSIFGKAPQQQLLLPGGSDQIGRAAVKLRHRRMGFQEGGLRRWESPGSWKSHGKSHRKNMSKKP